MRRSHRTRWSTAAVVGLAVCCVLLVAAPAYAVQDRYAFVLFDGSTCKQTLDTANADGSGDKKIATISTCSTFLDQIFADLSPDGQQIVFGWLGTLKVASVQTGSVRTIWTDPDYIKSNGPTGDPHGRWSPDGQSIVFADKGTVYTIHSDGSGLTTLLSRRAGGGDPAYSPDGQYIVYSSQADSKTVPSIWRVTASGGSRTELVKYPNAYNVGLRDPSYSPDGTQLVFETTDLHMIGVAPAVPGPSPSPPTWFSRPGANRWPNWTPDGRIVFSTARNHAPNAYGWDTYIINRDGSNETPLMLLSDGSSATTPTFRAGNSPLSYTDYLARTYAPMLRFDSSEAWRPLDVDQFFAENQHRVCDMVMSGCYPIHNYGDLVLYPTANGYIDVAGSGDWSNYKSPYSECNTGVLQDCDTGSRSAIYYHAVPTSNGYTYLDYWFFYRFNHYSSDPVINAIHGDEHEGDWEGITVAPSLTSNSFDFASLSQHGVWFSYLRGTLQCDRGGQGSCGDSSIGNLGTRVESFVAAGDQPNYPIACSTNDCSQTLGTRCTLQFPICPENNHDGAVYWGRTDDPASVLQFPATSPTGIWTEGPKNWVDWPGTWGSDEGGAKARGPSSPGDPFGPNGDHFYHPWVSYCADNTNCQLAAGARVRRNATAASNPGSPCDGWFGGDVVALACNPGQLSSAIRHGNVGSHGSFGVTVNTGHRVSAAGSGVSQIVSGTPLEPGDQVVLQGHVPAGTEIRVRTRTSRFAGAARFVAPRGSTRVRVLRVVTRRGRPRLVVVHGHGLELRQGTVSRIR